MTKRYTVRILMLLLIGWALPLAVLAASQEGSYDRVYTLDHLQPRVAEILIWEICDEVGGDEVCRVRTTSDNALAVVGPDAFHSAVARMVAAKDVNPRPTQTFLIALVAASRDGEGVDAEIPESAADALRDVSEFMPYRRFDLVDSGWIRTSQRGSVRLAGENSGMVFEVTVVYEAIQQVDRIDLNLGGFGVERVHANGEHEGLISTSLRMDVGETVVVGTSKPDGHGSALVAVLTAVP